MSIFKRFSKSSSKRGDPVGSSDLTFKRETNDIVESLLIPEPTKSLLWTTNEDTSKIEHAGSVSISISIASEGIDASEVQNGFYSEPSLIWRKLLIEPNNELIQETMYWPSYSSFSPKARYQYLRWLGNITQETNLSYVFLYFYGLERHLLVGDYDKAVDEIARLLKAHPKSSFIRYASQSLIVASLVKKRLDIIDRIPSLLEEEIDEALALRVIKGTSMIPDDIISISSRVGFKNKRYIKLYPQVFKEELQKQIDKYESQYGNLLGSFKLDDFEKIETTVFANLSIPEHARHVKIPSILGNKRFSEGMFRFLQAAHDGVKARISSGDVERSTPPRTGHTKVLSIDPPISNEEVNSLIKNAEYDGGILDLHFALQECISEHYSKRQSRDDYRKAIAYCRAQIKIQGDIAKAFLKEYPEDSTLPAHTGYKQLTIILEKEKKFDEAIELAKEARKSGWSGDWDRRIERLRSKALASRS